jgi:hypothetical protein
MSFQLGGIDYLRLGGEVTDLGGSEASQDVALVAKDFEPTQMADEWFRRIDTPPRTPQGTAAAGRASSGRHGTDIQCRRFGYDNLVVVQQPAFAVGTGHPELAQRSIGDPAYP